tara:strand:- start:404 stop:1027 length:624 start_codon:yes stop_codon:yes gene_type:complete
MKAIGILPTLIYEKELPPEIFSQLLSLCNTIDWDSAETYAGGSSSTDVLQFPQQDNILSQPSLFKWKRWAEEQLDFISEHAIKDNYSSNVKINAAWMNRYTTGDYNRSHSHPWSLYSGVVFLTGDADNMVFIQPNAYNEEVLKVSNAHDMYQYPAINGKMVVFPSSLKHFVMENQNDTIRYTLAFNAMPSKVSDGHTVQFNNCHTDG